MADSFAEAYTASNETNLLNAYYERPAMLALAGDVAVLPFPDDTFDDVTASLVLHSLEDWGRPWPAAARAQARRTAHRLR